MNAYILFWSYIFSLLRISFVLRRKHIRITAERKKLYNKLYEWRKLDYTFEEGDSKAKLEESG